MYERLWMAEWWYIDNYFENNFYTRSPIIMHTYSYRERKDIKWKKFQCKIIKWVNFDHNIKS